MRSALLSIAIALSIAACRPSESPPSPPAATQAPQRITRSTLLDVVLPDLSVMDAPVQAQARERHATLIRKRADPNVSDAELGTAFGELGMLLQAAEYFDAAEPALLDAQALQPNEMRWPYYLGHLYRNEGAPAKAIESFKQALALKENDVATLVWLGQMYLEQGQPENAAPLFERAAAVPPRSVAAVAGLGQTALARRDYARAVQLLEEALTIDPRVASIHSPLANAYRGLGDQARAEAHVKLWRNTELPVPDPLMDALKVSVESGLVYELQGVAALQARDFKTAAAHFRRGLELTRGNTALARSLRHKLGTALALSGDLPAAVRQFEETTRLAPADGLDEAAAKAHYSLGVLMAGNNRTADAIRHLTAATRFSPNYIEARLALADALRRSGRVEASLAEYAEVVRMNPAAASARFGYAMGLVRLRRYAEARDWLTEAVRMSPDQAELAHALARLLAAAPDDRVRDGQRAMGIVKELFAASKAPEVGETMAMALAEIGQFADAAAIQRGVIDAARRSGNGRVVRRLTANLQLYERGMPCRTPWPDDDPVHAPGPQGS